MRRCRYFSGLLITVILAVPAFCQRYGHAPTGSTGSILTSGHMPAAAPSVLNRGFGAAVPGTRYSAPARGNHGPTTNWGYVPSRGNRNPYGNKGYGNYYNHDGYRHRPNYGGYYPYYYGYYAPMPVYIEDNSSLPGAGTFDTGQGYEQEEPPPGYYTRPPSDYFYRPRAGSNSVRDEQDRYGEHYTDSREETRNEAPAHATISANGNESNDVTTVLIFKDGFQREVSNYAIMGQYVYVFSGDRRKIPLSEIDVDATKKANEDRGNEFSIPGSSNPS